MKQYYKQLINKRKLINFFIFSNINIMCFFKINYKYIINLFKKNVLFSFQKLNLILKRLIPLFNSIIDCSGKFLFIGNESLYLQTISYVNKINSCSKFEGLKTGVLTNLSIGIGDFMDFFWSKKPSIIISFNLGVKNFLLFEAKKVNIPIIGLIDGIQNSSNIEYPIFLNVFYFYNIYILSRFFFKYLVQLL